MPDVAPPGMPEPQPQGQPPAQAGGGGSNRTLMIVGAIVLLAAIAVIAFMVGKSKGEDDIKSEYKPGQPKYSAIYEAGQNAGQATGEKQGQATGQAQGESSGKKQGAKAGLEKGQQLGQVTGANDVFNAFSGGWDVGSYYIVQIGQGSNGVDYTLASRKEMTEGQQYALCESDPSEICQFNSPVQQ